MEKKQKIKLFKTVLVGVIVLIFTFFYFYYKLSSVTVNKVHINNMLEDDSTNYRYIFRKQIEKDKHEESIQEELKEFK